MLTTGKLKTNLNNKCGSYKHYEPLNKKGTEYCRGTCKIARKCGYRQRTDTCKRYEVKL